MRAVQLLWSTWSEMCDLLTEYIGVTIIGGYADCPSIDTIALVDMKTGRIIARQGDWIVRP